MKRKIRSQSGVSGLVFVLGCVFMILVPLGLLGWEYLRYSLVQQELRSVANAAALAGAVGIATNGSGMNTLWDQDRLAMCAAYAAFCNNTITDTPFVAAGVGTPNVNVSDAGAYQAAQPNQPNHFNNATPWTTVAPHTAEVNFVLLDQSGNQTNWSAGAGSGQSPLTSAASLRVDAYYSYSPPLLGALGIGPFIMTASSTGGLPKLDVILCFDVSGSMDDFTNVTLVNRFWASTKPTAGQNKTYLTPADVTALGLPNTFTGGVVEYDIVPCAGITYPAPKAPYWNTGSDGVSASGPLYYVAGCNTNSNAYNGTAVNVQPPENLNQLAITPNKFFFMGADRKSTAGSPPGNFTTPGNPPNDYGSTATTVPTQSAVGQPFTEFTKPCFTDLVVNLNGDAHWGFGSSVTQGSATFQNVAWALEASRGNMESGAALKNAVDPEAGLGANYDNQGAYIIRDASGVPHYFTTTTGYAGVLGAGQPGAQSSYFSYVKSHAQPFKDSVDAAYNFFKFLYGSADCHFGLVCFSDGIGVSPTSSWTQGSQAPAGSSSINGWTTAAVAGGSGTQSANIAGLYTGGPGMGPPSGAQDPAGPDNLGGNGTFILPLVQLDAANDNYTNNLVNTPFAPGTNMVALGSTDITDALHEAIRELTPGSGFTRQNATRAIVLFTDGSPNIDPSAMPPAASFSQCVTDCQTQGSTAGSTNPPITIMSIGLAMDPNMVNNQQTCLTDITTAAGGQSTWQQIQQASQINQAFQSIAKNLVVITK